MLQTATTNMMGYDYITVGRLGDPNLRVRDLRIGGSGWIRRNDCVFDEYGRVTNIKSDAIVLDDWAVYHDVHIEKVNDWTFIVDLTKTQAD